MIPELQAAPPPDNLVTFLWLSLGALAAVILYLWRELRLVENRHAETQRELLEKVLHGLHETNTAIGGLVDAVGAYQQQFSILQEIEQLRKELRHGDNS